MTEFLLSCLGFPEFFLLFARSGDLRLFLDFEPRFSMMRDLMKHDGLMDLSRVLVGMMEVALGFQKGD
jgi:hypothetical protein